MADGTRFSDWQAARENKSEKKQSAELPNDTNQHVSNKVVKPMVEANDPNYKDILWNSAVDAALYDLGSGSESADRQAVMDKANQYMTQWTGSEYDPFSAGMGSFTKGVYNFGESYDNLANDLGSGVDFLFDNTIANIPGVFSPEAANVAKNLFDGEDIAPWLKVAPYFIPGAGIAAGAGLNVLDQLPEWAEWASGRDEFGRTVSDQQRGSAGVNAALMTALGSIPLGGRLAQGAKVGRALEAENAATKAAANSAREATGAAEKAVREAEAARAKLGEKLSPEETEAAEIALDNLKRNQFKVQGGGHIPDSEIAQAKGLVTRNADINAAQKKLNDAVAALNKTKSEGAAALKAEEALEPMPGLLDRAFNPVYADARALQSEQIATRLPQKVSGKTAKQAAKGDEAAKKAVEDAEKALGDKITEAEYQASRGSNNVEKSIRQLIKNGEGGEIGARAYRAMLNAPRLSDGVRAARDLGLNATAYMSQLGADNETGGGFNEFLDRASSGELDAGDYANLIAALLIGRKGPSKPTRFNSVRTTGALGGSNFGRYNTGNFYKRNSASTMGDVALRAMLLDNLAEPSSEYGNRNDANLDALRAQFLEGIGYEG